MDLNQTYVRPAVHKLRDSFPEDALSQNINGFLTPEFAEHARQSITEIISLAETMSLLELRREQRTLELETRRRDNSTIWVEIWLALLLDEQDKPRGIVGVTRDLTNVGRRRVNCACSTQNWKDA